MTDEALSGPYVAPNPPEDMMDVLDEMKRFVALIATVVAASPHIAGALLADATKQPGQAVMIQQARLGLAMESWLGQSGQEMIEIMGEAVPKLLADSFVAMHKAVHDA